NDISKRKGKRYREIHIYFDPQKLSISKISLKQQYLMSKDVVILGAPLVEDSLTEIKWIYKKFFILVTQIRDLWLIVEGFYISSHLFSMHLFLTADGKRNGQFLLL
ncbi:hypothetical protein AABB24_009813, partial [Solanum stoloniferum]